MSATDRKPGTFRVVHIRINKALHKRVRHFAINEELDTARAIEALLAIGLEAISDEPSRDER